MSQLEVSPAQEPERASLFQIFKAISWCMLGVRQKKACESDVGSITPVQAVIAGLVGGVMFIGTVLLLVILAIKYMG